MVTKFTWRYALTLLAVMIVGVVAATAGVFASGRTLVWHGDEFYQGFNNLIFMSNAARDAVASFFAGTGFNFPAYTLNVGYGADLYDYSGVFGNIFNWLSVFCPTRFLEAYYVGMIFVRVVLSAFTFSYFCLRRGKSYEASLVGSVCYALCGNVILLGVLRHPIFLTPAVLFPLILAGADGVFKRERYWVFVLAMAAQFLSSMYLAYMICIALVVYCLIKYFFDDRKRSTKDFLVLLGRFVLLLLIAFAMAAVFAYPYIASLLSIDRIGLPRYKAMLFPLNYYIDLISDAVGISVRTKSVYFGGVGIVLIAAFLLCGQRIERKERIPWTIGFGLVVLCVLVPALNRTLNGGAYTTDRWMFIAGFCGSYIVCLMVPVLKQLTRKEWARVLIAAAAVVAYCIWRAVFNGGFGLKSGVMMALFVVAVAVVVVLGLKAPLRVTAGALTAVVIACIAANSAFYCLPSGSDYASDMLKRGTAVPRVTKDAYPVAIEDLGETGAFRYTPVRPYKMRNAGLNHEGYSVDFYNSKYTQSVDNLRKELGLSDDYFNFRYVGSTSRLALDALTGTRYYVTNGGEDAAVIPYGYEKLPKDYAGYEVYETGSYVPMAFATTSVIARSDYDSLEMAQKQEVLLEGCVLDDEALAGYETAAPRPSAQKVEVRVEGGEDTEVDMDAKTITVLKDGAEVHLEFEGLPGSETYVQFANLQYGYLKPSELAELRGKDASGMGLRDALATYPITYDISVTAAGISDSYEMATNRNPRYGGRHNWVLNTGYAAEGKTSADLEFSETGVYSFDELTVVCQPVEPLVEKAEALAAGAAEGFSFDGHAVEATFDAAGAKSWAVFTVPYSKGWSATVDGEVAEVHKADTAFMAVELPSSGKHVVRLTFENPTMKVARVLTVVGIAAFVALLVFGLRRRRVKEQNE